jgi:4a-hydroxytetrahydrobiopterin dehydratase
MATSLGGSDLGNRLGSKRLGFWLREHMDALADKTCTPCRGGIPPLTPEEAARFHVQVPDWELRDDAHRIERSFRFQNFREALAFVQQVGELAEAQGHHPDISFGWGYATVSLRTKKIKGLHENDFIVASRIDRLYGSACGS